MRVVLDVRVVFDLARNLLTVEGARVVRSKIEGLGDAEVELIRKVEESNEAGDVETGVGKVSVQDAPPPVQDAPGTPKRPGNLMSGVPALKPAANGGGQKLLADLMALGIEESRVCDLVKTYSADRLVKLLNWVRTVQAREGCTSPSSLFLRCLSKGVQ